MSSEISCLNSYSVVIESTFPYIGFTVLKNERLFYVDVLRDQLGEIQSALLRHVYLILQLLTNLASLIDVSIIFYCSIIIYLHNVNWKQREQIFSRESLLDLIRYYIISVGFFPNELFIICIYVFLKNITLNYLD